MFDCVPSGQVFELVSIICEETSKQPAVTSSGSSVAAISLFAALGFGTIIAAVFTRWNSVSQLRQAWVNDLRSEIADFFDAIEGVRELAGQGQTPSDFAARRSKALHLYRKVQLRLNMSEHNHRLLNKRLTGLLTLNAVAPLDRVDAAILAARRVLKEEWERTKYGPFIRVARRVKRIRKVRSIRRDRKRRSAR
jgi:hypothetical protein